MSKGLSPQALALCEKYGLNTNPDDPWADVHVSSKYKIITRQGIDKIEAKAGVKTIALDCLFIDPYEVVFKGTFILGEQSTITTASASIDRITPAIHSNKSLPAGLKAIIKKSLDELNEGVDGAMDRLKILTSESFIEESSGNVQTGVDRSGNNTYATICLKKGNVQQSPPYLAEMAEKRCKSRGVLKLAGFYELGFYSQDEAEEFKSVVDSKKNNSTKVES